MIRRIVVLGAAGDLATRHLLPALAHLLDQGHLPGDLRVVGVGREPLTSDGYRDLATTRLESQAPHVPLRAREELVGRLDYHQLDLEHRPDLGPLLEDGPVIAYLALPPSVYPKALRALKAAGLRAGSRVVVEKPFGEDLASARELSRLLHDVAPEREIYRIDHFLYHQMVQDLLALRLGSPVFETVWNREYVESVEIRWEETAGLAGRADFFDRTGALKDMVQSHLLQLLSLVAMEPPDALDEQSLRDAKVAALRRVCSLDAGEVAVRTARGRYTSGEVRGVELPDYIDEAGVDLSRNTETYAALELTVDSPRWTGVPFLLRTGKALGGPARTVTLHFRPTAGRAIAAVPMVLRLGMAPDTVTFQLPVSGVGGLPDVGIAALEVTRPRQQMPASARMLRDVLAGDPTFTVRDDEAEQCWRIVDPIVAAWKAGAPVLQDYEAGSAGPRLPWA